MHFCSGRGKAENTMSQARATRCARKYSMRINVEVGSEQCVTKEWATLSMSCKPLWAPGLSWVLVQQITGSLDWTLGSGLPDHTRLSQGSPRKVSTLPVDSSSKAAILAAAPVWCFYCLCSFKNLIREYRMYINKNTAWAFKQCLLWNHDQMALWPFRVPWP